MGLSKETLAMLGLSENATDEEVSAKVAELNGAKIKAEGDRDKFKSSFDKTSSELASIKKERMTDEEKRQAELKEIQDRLVEAELKNKLNETEKQYLGVGMDSETASKMAKAVIDGDLTAQGEIMRAYTETVASKAKAEALKSQPTPTVGNPSNLDNAKYTKENFKKGLISMEEMTKLSQENPELYKKIIG